MGKSELHANFIYEKTLISIVEALSSPDGYNTMNNVMIDFLTRSEVW